MRLPRPNPHSQRPVRVLRYRVPVALDDAGLDVFAYSAYLHVWKACALQRECDDTVGAIASSCRMSERQARRALKELERRRMLTITREPGCRSRYRPTHPQEWRR